jgi:hypothetical protein
MRVLSCLVCWRGRRNAAAGRCGGGSRQDERAARCSPRWPPEEGQAGRHRRRGTPAVGAAVDVVGQSVRVRGDGSSRRGAGGAGTRHGDQRLHGRGVVTWRLAMPPSACMRFKRALKAAAVAVGASGAKLLFARTALGLPAGAFPAGAVVSCVGRPLAWSAPALDGRRNHVPSRCWHRNAGEQRHLSAAVRGSAHRKRSERGRVLQRLRAISFEAGGAQGHAGSHWSGSHDDGGPAPG